MFFPQGVVARMLGRRACMSMSILVFVYAFGSATAYLIILGDTFQPMLQDAFGMQ